MKKLLTALLVVLSTLVFANDKGGNGGVSVVCRDANESITSAETLDIYEGRERYQKIYAATPLDIDVLIQLAQLKLVKHVNYLDKLQKEISQVKANIVFIKEGNEVLPTDDAFPVIAKKGCKFEQLANYTEDGEVLISQEIYDELDNLNKASLYLHEAIYAIRRTIGDTNSQRSRKLTAELLAINSNQDLIDQLAVLPAPVPAPTPKPPKYYCGYSGSIIEMIKDCSDVSESTRWDWKLVRRLNTLHQPWEMWLDTTSNLLWVDASRYATSSFSGAMAECKGQNLAEWIGIRGISGWRLPREDEWKDARVGKVEAVLPHMGISVYWGVRENGQPYAFAPERWPPVVDEHWVKCVAKLKE